MKSEGDCNNISSKVMEFGINKVIFTYNRWVEKKIIKILLSINTNKHRDSSVTSLDYYEANDTHR